MKPINAILSDIKNGQVKPIYLLMGEEPYYIDLISNYIEKTVLTEAEKGFNLQVMYGRDVSVDIIVSAAKRYPMMAEKQVIIVKEAQDLLRTIDNIAAYAAQPQPTTVLVLNFKYKKLDKRKKAYKAISKSGVVFESKKLYENQIADWIRDYLAKSKYKIEPKAAFMLADYLGSDLGKIVNELKKLQLILPNSQIINDAEIEKNIGISKDFNNFELTKAIGVKDVVKTNRIINYFAANPKNNPLVLTISLLNNFFTKLLLLHGLKDKSKSSVAKNLGVNPYFVDDYFMAAKHYPMRKVAQIIAHIRVADVKSKGVGANLSDADNLKELVFKILH